MRRAAYALPYVAPPIGADILGKLVSWWELAEPSGNRVDSCGLINAVPDGTVGYLASGGPSGNPCLDLSAASGRLIMPSVPAEHSNLSEEGLSLGGWVYRTGVGGVAAVIGKWDSTGPNALDYLLRFSGADAQFFVPGSPGYEYSTAVGVAALNTWQFVVGTYDFATNESKLYVDGALADTTTHADSVVDTPATTVAIGSNGGSGVFGNGVDNFIGRLSRVFIARGSLLTATEIAWLYNGGASRGFGDLT